MTKMKWPTKKHWWCHGAASEPEVQAEDRVEQHTEPPRIDEVDACCM